ncbi:MAG: peptide chain release factor N(5)-glutamine methyltransferase [Nitrospiraceae bacterium]|nr:peptide chain release factor N(5)-glutamine methyltransferase [Nitrospiraceae bacterium]
MVEHPSAHERPITVDSWLVWATRMLLDLDDPAGREARGLMASLLGSAASVVTRGASPLPPELADRYVEWVERRQKREPFHLITGEVPFFGNLFSVRSGVLIPRPETELLVEQVSVRTKSCPPQSILELGGGSGAIICSLLLLYPGASGVAVDIEPDPIRCMLENRKRLSLDSRLHLLRGNWDDSIAGGLCFDLLVSNPPYIASAEIDGLMAEVVQYEPHRALDGGVDGLDCYREILGSNIDSRVMPGGLMVMEIGAGQRWAFERSGPFFELEGFDPAEVVSDWAGHGRVVIWKRKG